MVLLPHTDSLRLSHIPYSGSLFHCYQRAVKCKIDVFSNTYTIFILIWPADEKAKSKTKIEIVR